ncbi:unnamed protein product [Camellia sinensis]
MAIIGDALRQAFMPKREYESLRDEDRAWLRLQRPLSMAGLAFVSLAIVISTWISLSIVFPSDGLKRPFCVDLRVQPLSINASDGDGGGESEDLFSSAFYLTDQETVDYYWMVLFVPSTLLFFASAVYLLAGSMDKTLEYLRRDERDVLDKSGPKIIRHKPITALLSPTELDPYIPLHTASEDLVYTGIRNCCEILEKGHSKSIGSFPVSILRPFSEDLDCSEFNTLLKRMKHEKLKWDNSFNKCGIYAAIYVSQFAYARNVSLLKGFLERWSPDTNTFHTIYGELGISLWDLHRISGLPICGEFYEEFTPSNDILYSSQTSKACRGLFNIYASSVQSKKFNHWTFKFIDESPTLISGFQRKDRIPDDVYLSGFLASWLSGFVFPHSSGEIRPTTFHVATKMAGGTLFSLAIPVLAYLYHSLGKMASSSSPGKENIQGPLHYFFGWISLYFVKTYSHGDPQLICPIPDIHFMPYLGFIGNQSAAQFFNDKFPFVDSLLTYRTECQFRALTHEKKGITVAYTAPTRHWCLKVVENNYCASKRGGVRCLSILNAVFAIIFGLLAIILGSSLLTLGSSCSLALFWCYEIASWGLVMLYGGTAFFLRSKAAVILGEGNFSGRNLGLEMLEAYPAEVTPEVERHVNEGFKTWMGSSLLSSDEEDEPDDYQEVPHPVGTNLNRQRV